MLDSKRKYNNGSKESVEELCVEVGELPDMNSPTPSTGALLVSVADHNSVHGVPLAVVAVRLHSSGLQGSTLHPAKRTISCALTPTVLFASPK